MLADSKLYTSSRTENGRRANSVLRRGTESSGIVGVGLNPKKIASKGFIVLSDSAGHDEFQKKSP